MKIVIIIAALVSLSAFANAQTSHTMPALIAKDGCSGTLQKAIHVCARLSDNANTEVEKDVAQACLAPLLADDIIFTRGFNTLNGSAEVLGFFRFFRGPHLDKSQTMLSDHRITDASNVHGANTEGDMITLDIPGRQLNVDLSDEELKKRAAIRDKNPPRVAPKRGYARLFDETILQADKGCDFDFLVKQ